MSFLKNLFGGAGEEPQNDDVKEKEFVDRLQQLYRPTWEIKTEPIAGGTHSFIGGTSDQATPPCPSCGDPTKFIAHYNPKALAISELEGWAETFSCFACIRCLVETTYSETHKSCCHVISLNHKAVTPDARSKRIIVTKKNSLPDWQYLNKYDSRLFDLSCEMEGDPWDRYTKAEDECGHQTYESQIGGFAGWFEGDEIVRCPECETEMNLLLQLFIEDIPEDVDDELLGCGSIYFLMCQTHKNQSVLAYQCE